MRRVAGGSDQAGWVVLGAALIAALGSVVDRLIARWRPGLRRRNIDRSAVTDALTVERAALATERKQLNDDWAAYRSNIDAQLAACRQESAELRREIEHKDERITELRGKVASLSFTLSTMRARLRAAGIPMEDQ